MAPYDSDSSGGEDNDYTETNVLLGYASKEASDDTISHLGGRPVCSTLLRNPLYSKIFEGIFQLFENSMLTILPRNGSTPLPLPRPHSQSVKYAMTL